MALLPESERNVIALRFGLQGAEPLNLRQTGIELGIPLSKARELEQQGLTRLAKSSQPRGASPGRVNGPRKSSRAPVAPAGWPALLLRVGDVRPTDRTSRGRPCVVIGRHHTGSVQLLIAAAPADRADSASGSGRSRAE